MSSLTLNVPFSQINIKHLIRNEVLKSLWCMSYPHLSWRLCGHGFPLPGVFLITWFHFLWISFTVFLQEHRFLLITCLFHDTNCISKVLRGTRSQHCCHTCQWARAAEFQTGYSTCLPVVAIALRGPSQLPSNCFHQHYAFCPYTSSSWPFMSRSLSLNSSSTLATSLRLGRFAPNFLAKNSSDEHICTLVRRVPRGNQTFHDCLFPTLSLHLCLEHSFKELPFFGFQSHHWPGPKRSGFQILNSVVL